MPLDLTNIDSGGQPADFPDIYNANNDAIELAVNNLSGNNESISQITSDITDISGQVVTNTGNIQTNTTDIDQLQTDLDNAVISGGSVTPSQLQALQDQIISNDADILSLSGDVSDNSISIDLLQSQILSISAGNLDDASLSLIANLTGNLQDQITDNDGDIAELRTDVNTISADLANLDTNFATDADLTALSGNLQTQITSNDIDIANLQAFDTQTIILTGNLQNQIVENDSDITNLQIQVDALNGITGSSGGSIVIGPAEDGTYLDGLFPFTPTTPVGFAVDNINEVLAIFSPPAPPLLSSMSSNTGDAGKLSFETGDLIAEATYVPHPTKGENDSFTTTSPERGIFDATTNLTGTLADDVTAHEYAYPVNSFSSGDKGDLILVLNGSTIHTVDLTTFASGSTLNGSDSGFTLSAATPVEFETGQILETFKFRTGTWIVDTTELVLGYNTIKVRHETSTGVFEDTQTFEYIRDGNVVTVTFSGQTVDALSMSGLEYLSGVRYHTGGTAKYDVTIDEAYRNTYSNSSITHPVTERCSLASTSIPAMTDELDSIVITDQTITIDTNARILNQGISVNTTAPKTLSRGATSSTASEFNLLLDPFTTNIATDTTENFNGESYRMTTQVFDNSTNLENILYSSGSSNSSFTWDSEINIAGSNVNHDDGLLQHNGVLQYPTQGTNGGNFNAIADGPSPNVNYSVASGNRTYLRYFYFPADPMGGSPKNFVINATVSSTFFVAAAGGPSGNNLTFEVLAPNTTQNIGGTIEFKDAFTPYSNDDSIGCYANTFGSTIPTDWGITLGSRTVFTSANVLVVRITASDAWTGNISNITITADS